MPEGTVYYNTLSDPSDGDNATTQITDIEPSILNEGDNILAVEVHQVSDGSTDLSFDLRLTAKEPAAGGSEPTTKIPTESTRVKARVLDASKWSAVSDAVFSVGPVAESLRITELMYHPEDPNTEFIELQNIGIESINLNLVKFTKGVDFVFPSLAVDPNEYVLVVNNLSEFARRYETSGLIIAGQYVGKLDNAGEKIKLVDALDQTIHDFRYKDGWFRITDGDGFSLTVRDAAGADASLWGKKDTWKASAFRNGTPGAADNGPSEDDIVINEILAHSDAEIHDWIELHNVSESEINIGGWFLSDNDNNEPNLMRYRIADGTTIEPDGYLVFNEGDHFGRDPADPRSFALSENGETVYLSSNDGDTLGGLRIKRSFGASLRDIAFGEYIKSTGGTDFVAMSENSPWAANKYPLVGPIVISEIMYHPADTKDAEYVELLNISDEEVFLYDGELGAGWRFEELDGDNRIVFSFTTPVSMAPGDRILLVKDLSAFESKFGAAVAPVFEWHQGNLGNGSNRIQLSLPGDIDNDGVRQYIRIDRVNYRDGNHPQGDEPDLWPENADGGVDAVTGKCYSLTRKSNFVYGNDVDSWDAVIRSPGSANPDIL